MQQFRERLSVCLKMHATTPKVSMGRSTELLPARCSYCACASSYNAIVLMDRVDFTRALDSEAAFGDLRITIDFLGAR